MMVMSRVVADLVLYFHRGHEVDFDLRKVFDVPNIEVSSPYISN